MVSLSLTIFTSLLASCYGLVNVTPLNVTEMNTITTGASGCGPCFPNIGCFPSTYPWNQRGIYYPHPWSPQDIGIYVTLYTRRGTEPKIEIYPSTPDLREAGYRPKKRTYFIIHGFIGNGQLNWMKRIKDVILKLEDANVFLVDWQKGAALINYFRAASNTRVVGAVLAWFGRNLLRIYKQDPSKIHVIGFSLGGQVASYMGKAAQNPPQKEWPRFTYNQLTALDPAGPGFEGYSEKIRLTKTDANFVEVIHTNGRPLLYCGFGMSSAVGKVWWSKILKTNPKWKYIFRTDKNVTYYALFIFMKHHAGHVDYYMNGGGRQPGCHFARNEKRLRLPGWTVEQLLSMPLKKLERFACFGCNHNRATLYYAEALENRLKKCRFMGYKLSESETTKMIDSLSALLYFVFKPAHLPNAPSRQRCLAQINYDHSKLEGALYVPIEKRRHKGKQRG